MQTNRFIIKIAIGGHSLPGRARTGMVSSNSDIAMTAKATTILITTISNRRITNTNEMEHQGTVDKVSYC